MKDLHRLSQKTDWILGKFFWASQLGKVTNVFENKPDWSAENPPKVDVFFFFLSLPILFRLLSPAPPPPKKKGKRKRNKSGHFLFFLRESSIYFSVPLCFPRYFISHDKKTIHVLKLNLTYLMIKEAILKVFK